MNINKAIEHFKWSLQNKWKPTETDVEAINSIIKFTKEKHEKQYNDNQLFGKLYIYVLGEYINFYKSSVQSDLPQKELHKLLDRPINQIISEFTTKANDAERYLRLKEAGLSGEHPATIPEAQKEIERSKIASIGMKIFDDIITEDEATDNLIEMVNLALNDYE